MSDGGGIVYNTLATVIRALWPGPQSQLDYLVTWDPPQSPLSTLPSVVFTLGSYLSIVFGLRAAINKGIITPPNPNSRHLKVIFVTHNVTLSLASGLLLIAILEEIIPVWAEQGFFTAICATSSYTPRLSTMYVINYLFKYVELLDTVFLVIKRKPLGFLHPYHHTATAFLCFTQLHGRTSVQWVVISLNLCVHFFMYGYYALMSLKIPCPWKRLVTTGQICQFVLDLGIIYYAAWNFGAANFAPWLPHAGECAGEEKAALFGCVIISSYLYLFVDFYKKTYSKTPAKLQRAAIAAAEKAIRSNGTATPADQEADYPVDVKRG